jgi:hypothetical protein
VVLRDGAVVDVLTDERVDASSVMTAIADAGSARDGARTEAAHA